MKLLLKISILAFILICVVNKIHAQIPGTPMDGVSISTDDPNPKPNQTLTVSIDSFNFDLNSSSIVWFVDGKVQNQGIGIKETSITTPDVGTNMIVSVKIKGSDGREVSKSLTIKPSSVDIIWESNGYTPLFYNGKIPFSYQNSIKLIAIPHLAKDKTHEIDPKTLVYSWKQDGKYIEGGQGYGKQSVTVQAGDIPRPLNISVDIYNREQTINTNGVIILEPSKPSLSFYEQNPIYGLLLNKSLTGKIPLIDSEMKILAVPYGFNLSNKDISYTWSVNSATQPNLDNNKSITIRTKGDTDSSSDIDLNINNQDKILQSAEGGFTVYFNKK